MFYPLRGIVVIVVFVYVRVSQPSGHGRIFDGARPCRLYFWNWVHLARWTSKTGPYVAMKRKLEAGLMWKMTWSVPYHVLSLGYLCFLTTNRLRLCIDCSAHCIIKCFLFLLYACATIVALEKLYSRWAMDPPFVY